MEDIVAVLDELVEMRHNIISLVDQGLLQHRDLDRL